MTTSARTRSTPGVQPNANARLVMRHPAFHSFERTIGEREPEWRVVLDLPDVRLSVTSSSFDALWDRARHEIVDRVGEADLIPF